MEDDDNEAEPTNAVQQQKVIEFALKNPTPDHVRPASSIVFSSVAVFGLIPFVPFTTSPAKPPPPHVLFLVLHCLGFFPIGVLLFKLTLVFALATFLIHPSIHSFQLACPYAWPVSGFPLSLATLPPIPHTDRNSFRFVVTVSA